MQFIRQNLFLVIVVGVFVIGGAALLVLTYQSADKRDADMQPRITVDQDIRAATHIVTQAKITELENRRTLLKDTAQQIADFCLKQNQKPYPVLPLIADAHAAPKPAFPDFGQYESNAHLLMVFKNTYRDELKKLGGLLSPVPPKTPGEIDACVQAKLKELTNKDLQDKLERENEERIKAATQHASETQPSRDHRLPGTDHGGLPGGAAPAAGGDDTHELEARAQAAAQNELQLNQAKGGKIFIDKDALDSYFPETRDTNVTKTQLWQAQINLWVQSDIVNAIVDANRKSADQIKQSTGVEPAGVLGSAVRRLIHIEVTRGYCLAAGGTGSSGSSTGSPTPSPSNTGLPGMSDMHPGASGTPSAATNGLTHRTCNSDYDVVTYEFKVGMPSRYIPMLLTSLLQRNFHTITKIDVAPLTPEAQPAAATGSPQTVPPYYGGDAMAEVTIQGELLLLTAWERGTWEKDDWSRTYPPLMPAEVLQDMKQSCPAAMRPEDLKRADTPRK